MKKLTRYMFKQLVFAILAITLVLTCIMWLAQSLRYIDFIANKGVPILLFFEMVFYLLPNLVVIVIPIAVLIGVLFIYNKLISDHELIVMQGSGASYFQLATPAILVASLFTLVLYFFTLYFLPLSFRNYRELSLTLKQKSLASLMQVGQFNTLSNYTVYARSRDAEGNFHGLLIYDGRDKSKKTFFMAEKGIVFSKADGGRLLLLKGNRQEKDPSTGKPSILYFDQYIIETIDPNQNTPEDRFLKPYERYVNDLFNPDEQVTEKVRREFLSAAHRRLLSPLYSIAFGLLAACAMLLGFYNRKGRTTKIITACIIATALEVSSIILLNTLKYAAIMIPVTYATVFITIGVCFYLLLSGSSIKLPLRLRRKKP